MITFLVSTGRKEGRITEMFKLETKDFWTFMPGEKFKFVTNQ